MNYFKLKLLRLIAVSFSLSLCLCVCCTSFCIAETEEKEEIANTNTDKNADKNENKEDDTFLEHLNKMEIPNRFKLKEIVVGNPQAKKTLIIYFSFTCPHCREFHANEYPKFKKEFVDTGKVKVIFRNYIDDQGAYEAAQIVRCLCKDSAEKYAKLSEKILKKQKEWLSSKNPGDFLVNIFVDENNDEKKVRECLKRTDIGAGLMLEEQYAYKMQIISMPTFIFLCDEDEIADNNENDAAADADNNDNPSRKNERKGKRHVGSITYDELIELCDCLKPNSSVQN